VIRSIVRLHAIAGRGDELLALVDAMGLRARLGEDRGLISAELLCAVDDPDELLLVSDWASVDQLERWVAGPLPGGFADRAAELTVEEPIERVYRVVEAVS
jgi:heme-degrading monooxygenase HmoA